MKTILAVLTVFILSMSAAQAAKTEKSSATGWLSNSGAKLAKQAKQAKQVKTADAKKVDAKKVKILKALPALPTTGGNFKSYARRSVAVEKQAPYMVQFEHILLLIVAALFGGFILFVATVVFTFRAIVNRRTKSRFKINRQSPVFRG